MPAHVKDINAVSAPRCQLRSAALQLCSAKISPNQTDRLR